MTLTLREGNFDAFFEAPFNAYGAASAYVSPLKGDLKRFVSRDNPLITGGSELTYFTAHRDGRAIGRITVHTHVQSNALHGLNMAYFGYFDCADDPNAARLLLEAAERWAQARGHDRIAGNFNLTAMQQIGVVTGGFGHKPYTDQVWSPPHIARLLGENGYAPQFPMATFETDIAALDPPPLGLKQRAILDDPAFRFAPVTRRTVADRMEDARAILNASFADNPMFVPVTAAEFQFQAKDMKWIMDPRISAVLHHHDRPVACVLCIPDLNPFLARIRSRPGLGAPWHFLRYRLGNRRAVLIFAGVLPELQGKGVNPLLLHHVMTAAKAAGYTRMGNTWVADVNGASLAQTAKAGATPMHRLHLFSKRF